MTDFINLALCRVLWVKQGAALIIKMVLETGVLSLGPHICCFRPLALNHISKVRAGPCAAYTAETRQSGERGAGLESCLSRSGAVVAHAVLLFGGRMIDRRMGDGEETAPILPHPMTTSLSARLVKDLKITTILSVTQTF